MALHKTSPASANRCVVITGASSGIGAACLATFAEHGWSVIAGARRLDRLKKLQDQYVDGVGARLIHIAGLDVTDDKSVQQFCAFVKEKAPQGIDVLLNNAGLAKGVDKVADGRMDDWQAMMDTNVSGLLRVTRGLLPDMIAHKKGHIVNMGSIAGFLVYEGGSVYCASKHAVRAITKTLRLELNGLPIRVTSIDPGMVETEFSQVRLQDDERAKAVYKGLKPLSAQDIADCVWWACDRPGHVNIDEIVVMPVAQAAPHKVSRT
jgi:3-hydroxy acid dehydrogenase / malonic semialdehyde reductase